MGAAFVIVGGGGFAREILDIVEAANDELRKDQRFDVVGVVADPAPDMDRLEPYGVPYLGPTNVLHDQPKSVGYVIAIGLGGGHHRRRIDDEFRDERHSPVIVHPNVTIGRRTDLGPGTIVCSHVSIAGHVTTGRHVHVGANAPIGHDTTLEPYVTVSPLTAVSGNVLVGAEATLGTGSAIRQKITVGAGAFVAAGAVVVSDVDPGATVKGVPARQG